jgi:transcriptional regulatory protein LevR
LFFHKEARRTTTHIEVSAEVLKALLLYDCPGNIGQILSDIQVSCARSFLNHIINQTDYMKVTIEDLPVHAKKGLLKIKNRTEVENLIDGNLELYPDNEPVRTVLKEDVYTFPSEIYTYIEQRYQELQNQGMQDDVINYVIGGELELRLKRMMKNIGANGRLLGKQDLIKIVGMEVVNVAEKMLKIAERKMGIAGENLFYCLSIHLKTTLDRLQEGKLIVNPQLAKIKESYSYEYKVALEMVQLVQENMNINIPEDEVGFITMYLTTLTENESLEEGKVGVVLISHGHVAGGMADVANRLLGVYHAKSVEMSLDESPEIALNRASEVVKNADEGKGVLLLVDMGSLVTFGELITQETGIRTRVITRVDTVLAVEAVRRAAFQDTNLDELADALEEERPKNISRLAKETGHEKADYPKALVTICITGEGSALKIKDLIEDLIPEIKDEIEVIPIGALTKDVKKLIDDLRKTKNIIAVVGTVNPETKDICFISIEDILRGGGVARIRGLLNINSGSAEETGTVAEAADNDSLPEILKPGLIAVNPQVETKDEVVRLLGQLLIDNGYVKNDFIAGVHDRETYGLTYAGNGMAIPHAEPSYVIKSGVAIAKMKNGIEWDGYKVNMVFMLALSSSNRNTIQDIYKILNSEEFIEAVKGAKCERQIINIIKQQLQ